MLPAFWGCAVGAAERSEAAIFPRTLLFQVKDQKSKDRRLRQLLHRAQRSCRAKRGCDLSEHTFISSERSKIKRSQASPAPTEPSGAAERSEAAIFPRTLLFQVKDQKSKDRRLRQLLQSPAGASSLATGIGVVGGTGYQRCPCGEGIYPRWTAQQALGTAAGVGQVDCVRPFWGCCATQRGGATFR